MWIILAAIIFISGYFVFKPTTSFSELKNTNNSEKIIAQNWQQQNAHPKDLTYIFIWKTGCKDCKKIQKQTIEPIATLQHQHKLISIDARHTKSIKYLNQQNVNYVPTLIVQRNHKKIYQYTGNNYKKFLALLIGKNPQTKKPLTNHFVYQNDFEAK